MRKLVMGWGLVGAGVAALGLQACGNEADSCTFDLTCAADGGGDSADATADVVGDTRADGSGDGATSDVYVPPDGGPCSVTDDPHDSGCKAQDGTGLFVSGKVTSTGDGSKGKPFATLGEAVGALSKTGAVGRIYVCAGDYAEKVTLDATLAVDVKIFGGLSCDTWSWTSGATVHVKPGKPDYALLVNGTTKGVYADDVTFEAPDAVGQDATTKAGNSSIAAFVSQATGGVQFTRVAFVAGKGAPGVTNGATPADWTSAAPDGNPGTASAGGGDQPAAEYTCPNGSGLTQGGRGGPSTAGGAGGFPGLAPAPTVVNDGAAGTFNGGTMKCTSGDDGAYGAGGKLVDGGAGNGASSAGQLGSAGWAPSNGHPGAFGMAAQGGGGGAGGTAGGGGGGGQGGCGGSGGVAGTGGGASFGLVLYKSAAILSACAATTRSGGLAGNGANGQNGQIGGARGLFGGNGCLGGFGGTGGSGGGGGGGAGGSSVGIGYVGTAPTVDGTSTSDAATLSGFTIGTAGAVGAHGAKGAAGASSPAGLQGDDGTDGAPGIVGAVKQLPGT